jgi:hypothetical protein
MLKKEFVELTKAEKVVLLLKSGKMLSRRNKSGFDLVLMLFDNIFAELWYHENTNKIVKVEIVEKELILVNYPELINLSHVSETLN